MSDLPARRDYKTRSVAELDYIYSVTRHKVGATADEYRPIGYLLYLNPEGTIATEPVIDEITQKMTAALREACGNGITWRGVHLCPCGACSTNTDYILPSRHQTNALAIHYLGVHREDVPEEQLEIISGFNIQPVEPTVAELQLPRLNNCLQAT